MNKVLELQHQFFQWISRVDLLWDSLDPTPNCVRNTTQPTYTHTMMWNELWDPRVLQSDSRNWLCLTLSPGSGFTCQWVGNSPRVFRTLNLPTSEPALALGPWRVLQPAASRPGPAKQQPEASAQDRAWQPTTLGYQIAHIISPPQQKDPRGPLRGNSESTMLGWWEGSALLGRIGCLTKKALTSHSVLLLQG